MIFTHPVLFDSIVVFFIAFTAGWLVYALVDQRNTHLRNKMEKMEMEKQDLLRHAQELEEQLQAAVPLKNTPVISIAAFKAGTAGDAAL